MALLDLFGVKANSGYGTARVINALVGEGSGFKVHLVTDLNPLSRAHSDWLEWGLTRW